MKVMVMQGIPEKFIGFKPWWCIISLISLAFFVVLSTGVLASGFNFTYPKQVTQNFSFNVNLILNSTKVYDVKVYSEDPDHDPKTITRIYDPIKEVWKNSNYYVYSSYPRYKTYQLKFVEGGNWTFCVRIRNKSSSTVCGNITVLKNVNSEGSNEGFDSNQDNKSSEGENSNSENSQNGSNIENINWANISEENESGMKKENGVIYLNSPNANRGEGVIYLNSLMDNKTENKTSFGREEVSVFTTTGKENHYIFYVFTGICVLLIVLLALRRL